MKRQLLRIRTVWKLAAAAYLLLGCLILLTGRTAAHYTDAEVLTGTIQAGVWETKEECGQEDGCGAPFFSAISAEGGTIQAVLENAGPNLKKAAAYRVYAGKQGERGKETDLAVTVFSEEKGKLILRFIPELPGFYTIEAIIDNEQSVWSGQAEAVISPAADQKVKQDSSDAAGEEAADKHDGPAEDTKPDKAEADPEQDAGQEEAPGAGKDSKPDEEDSESDIEQETDKQEE